VPRPYEIRERDPRLKQGSKSTPVDDSDTVHEMMRSQTESALHTYHELLSKGVAPELARTILPQNMYSEFIETASLAALARLCHLRLGPDAQKEIREYAGAVNECLKLAFPVSWKALEETF
jgi:thymidylate synthase (FAD)